MAHIFAMSRVGVPERLSLQALQPLRSAASAVKAWRRRAREEEALRRYMLYELKNARGGFGKEASIEANKPFWFV